MRKILMPSKLLFQGSTIRPIVELLKVKTANQHSKTMFEDINLRVI